MRRGFGLVLGFIGPLITATTYYNHWEQLSTGSFLYPLGPYRPVLLSSPIGLTSTALRYLLCGLSLSRFPSSTCCLLRSVLLSRSSFWSDQSNRLTPEACFSPTPKEAHVTMDTCLSPAGYPRKDRLCNKLCIRYPGYDFLLICLFY
jgi:hypothetical protein